MPITFTFSGFKNQRKCLDAAQRAVAARQYAFCSNPLPTQRYNVLFAYKQNAGDIPKKRTLFTDSRGIAGQLVRRLITGDKTALERRRIEISGGGPEDMLEMGIDAVLALNADSLVLDLDQGIPHLYRGNLVLNGETIHYAAREGRLAQFISTTLQRDEVRKSDIRSYISP